MLPIEKKFFLLNELKLLKTSRERVMEDNQIKCRVEKKNFFKKWQTMDVVERLWWFL